MSHLEPSGRAGRSSRRAGAVATLLVLGGCTSFVPPYERPAAPVTPAYAPESTPAGAAGAAAAADTPWQVFFADPRLKRLIELSLQNNRDLRIAVLNIEQARALYRIQRADEWPTIGAGVQAQRQPGGSGGVGTVYSVGLQVSSYELDFFGRVRALSQSALSQFLATEEARRATQIALVAGVASSYVSLLADDELLRVTREALQTREDSYRLTRLRFENGASSEVDVRQSEQLLETAKAALAQTLRQKSLDENALALLVGQPLPADLPAPLPLAAQQGVTDLPAGLPSDLLTRRPDVLAAEQQLLSANADIGAARAAMFPRIALTANAGTASGELSGLFKGGTWALTGTASLLQPIFDAGRNRANLDAARVGRDIAAAQYEQAIQTAFREVSDALAGRATLGEQLRAQTAVAAAAQANVRLADLRYRNGVSSYFDLLDAQRTLFTAQQQTVQTQALQIQNLVSLYRALGGGWTEPVAGNP